MSIQIELWESILLLIFLFVFIVAEIHRIKKQKRINKNKSSHKFKPRKTNKRKLEKQYEQFTQDSKSGKLKQEYINAIWEEIEPSHNNTTTKNKKAGRKRKKEKNIYNGLNTDKKQERSDELQFKDISVPPLDHEETKEEKEKRWEHDWE